MEEQKDTPASGKRNIGKIIFLGVVIVLAFLVFKNQQRDVTFSDFWSRDLDATLKKASAEKRKVMVFFMARRQNRTSVRMIKDSLEKDQIVRSQLTRSKYLPVVAIVDRTLKDEISKKYEIKELPTLMVLSHDGKILDRRPGFTGHADVTGMIVANAKK